MTRPFVKVIPPGAQEALAPEGAPVSLVKAARRGLRGDDLRALLKRAGHGLVERARRLELKPGEELVHLIALGAGESFGSNRNGDRFKRAVLEKYHPTFVKLARWYRDHQNGDPARSYGLVKLSEFDPQTQRVELIVALNATKEAADRNGGLVADEEMQKLAAGADLPVSMSCKVDLDVCSSCGNEARSRAEYCEADTCPHGGLKHNITKVSEDGHVLCADNPRPYFFDISKVWRPADRIAYVLGQVKEASGRVKSGAELAEEAGVLPPAELAAAATALDPEAAAAYGAVVKLAAAEAWLAPDGADWALAASAAAGLAEAPPAAVGRPELWRACADGGVLLSPRAFGELIPLGALAKAGAVAAPQLRPGLFGRLLADPDLEAWLAAGVSKPAAAAPKRAKGWAGRQAAAHGTRPDRLAERGAKYALAGGVPPRPRPGQKAAAGLGGLEREWGLYAAWTVARLAGPEAARVAGLAARLAAIAGR